jgi:hypothetical protein
MLSENNYVLGLKINARKAEQLIVTTFDISLLIATEIRVGIDIHQLIFLADCSCVQWQTLCSLLFSN